MEFCLKDSLLRIIFDLISNVFCQVLYKKLLLTIKVIFALLTYRFPLYIISKTSLIQFGKMQNCLRSLSCIY